jgi:hypothetical protein
MIANQSYITTGVANNCTTQEEKDQTIILADPSPRPQSTTSKQHELTFKTGYHTNAES